MRSLNDPNERYINEHSTDIKRCTAMFSNDSQRSDTPVQLPQPFDSSANEERRRESGGGQGESKHAEKDYQSLFWVPMLYQTAETAVSLLDVMIEDISDFYEASEKEGLRASITSFLEKDETSDKPKRRREQILGDDSHTNEVVATRVEVVTKSDDTKFTLLSILKSHFLFSKLHDYELEDVIDSMVDQYAEEGDVIITEGDGGDKYYCVEEGTVEIEIGGNVVGTMDGGNSFGDLALMYNSPRAATIRARTECTLWVLEKHFFRQAMVTSSSNQAGNLAQFLGKLKLFESLSLESLSQLAKSLTLKTYEDRQYIITQGEIGEHFFVIFKGKVRITKTGDDGREIPLITLNEGNVFGERALIKKEPRAANVIADGSVECYSLGRDDFASMLGGIVEQMTELNNFRYVFISLYLYIFISLYLYIFISLYLYIFMSSYL